MSKLFSPSLKLRSEPPNSKAKVMHVGTDTALVNFRGRSMTAKLLDDSITAGDSVSIIECPRNVFHIKKTGPSWYANPLENWAKAGKKACVALEYLLRKNKKWSPFVIGSGGTLLGKDPTTDPTGFGTPAGFAALDTNGDGGIDIEEWTAAGGDPATFAQLDTNGDGIIDQDEFTRGAFNGGLDGATPGSMGGTPQGVAGGAVPAGWDAYSGPSDFPGGFDPEALTGTWWGFTETSNTADISPGGPMLLLLAQVVGSTAKCNVNWPKNTTWGHVDEEDYYYSGLPYQPAIVYSSIPSGANNRVFYQGASGPATFDRLMLTIRETTSLGTDPDSSEALYNEYKAFLLGLQNARLAEFNAANPKFIICQNGSALGVKDLTFHLTEDNNIYPDTYEKAAQWTGILWAEVRI